MKNFISIAYIFISIMLVIVVRQYLFCPQYEFEPTKPFSGDQWYNPYQSLDTFHWLKANFHAHSNAWHGITNGHGKASDIDRVYNDLGYQIRCISDYHKINIYLTDSAFIPVYEHGYNLTKTHQQLLGSDKVTWVDYILPQTLSNKQFVLEKLYQEGSIVVLNHPTLLNGYTPSDVKNLHGYHSMEVVSGYTQNEDIWDVALSAGKPIFILANDGLHNIFKKEQYGRWCTMIHTQSAHKDTVLSNLKRGRSYGMQIGFNSEEDSIARNYRIRHALPKLFKAEISNDSLLIKFDQIADHLKFIGQEGELLAVINNTDSAKISLNEVNHYVRIKSLFKDGSIIYLNPIFKYEDIALADVNFPTVKQLKSYFLYAVGWFILMAWFLLILFQTFEIAKYFIPLIPFKLGKKNRNILSE